MQQVRVVIRTILAMLVLAVVFPAISAADPDGESHAGFPPWQDAGNAGQLEEAFGHGWFPDKNKWYAERYERIILRGVRRTSDIFQVNDVMTTLFGPAWANIWLEGENFLECSPPQGRDFSYALCYYSGPEDPTGQSADNPALPCTLSPSGKLANCKCYKLSTDQVPPKVPYFVDIHAILNKDIYLKTVEACGEDGSKCAPTTSIEAPVCSSINSNQLIPGADLVSVFSPVKKLDYFAGSTPCKSLYAGCMTAPCYDTGEKDANGKPLVDCSCPIFEGPFEIGQGADQGGGNQLQCELGGRNVWSAAHNPKSNNPITPQPPAGACFPDAPPDSGCPLYPAGSGSVDPNGAVCRTVCEAYSGDPAAGGVQVGYTCDSALCTALGLGQDLPWSVTMAERFGIMGQACNGVQNLDGLELITQVEKLAGCSCCASQICGCSEANISAQTNSEIIRLNAEQRAVGINPQCDINGTLCGGP
ncbi:hypothetical protein [Microbulbifer taiwanensis]|uniref:Conjugal transfer protein TraN n=1 Tax=Microbulbifer taiwanensis TaxID=986746 RepID=A0ABW1YGJ7_9GAMM|nr:hypothetical protein [Microbulbifer taiwanensis]